MHRKETMPFFFQGESHQEMVKKINDKLPIQMIELEEIINRVYNRYPLISKSEVTLIIKTVLEGWREILILGETLSLPNVIFNMKLHFFVHMRKKILHPALKTRLGSSITIKKRNIKNDL